MELPPPSSLAQVSAYFTGSTELEQKQQFLAIQPHSFGNKFIDSSDRSVSKSLTGLDKDFKTEDYVEAYKMWFGQAKYPFQSIADITNHQFDPSYFDGSENQPSSFFNVQENLIGTPMGSSVLLDPRVTYIDNLLKLREYTAGNMPLDESYLNQLYMSETEKGANYYFNQLEDLREAMGLYARGSQIKNTKDLHSTYFSNHVGQGVTEHPSNTVARILQNPSVSPQVQANFRRERMNKIDQLSTTYATSIPPLIENKKEEGVSSIRKFRGDPLTPLPVKSKDFFVSAVKNIGGAGIQVGKGIIIGEAIRQSAKVASEIFTGGNPLINSGVEAILKAGYQTMFVDPLSGESYNETPFIYGQSTQSRRTKRKR